MPELFKKPRLKKPLKPLSPRWKSFAGDEKGIIIVMFALMLPLLVGFVGLGVEVAFWFTLKRDLQAAADAAAVAGSYELAEGRSSSITTAATREAASNGWEAAGGSIAVNNPPTNASYPTYLANTDAVEVELTRSETRLFSGWFMSDTVTVNARAVGLAVAGSSTACILALGSSDQSGALKVTGNNTDVTMSGCTAATNSEHDDAVDVTEKFVVDCIYSAGGIDGSPDTTACASPGKTNQPEITDPYETGVTKPANSDFDDCAVVDGGDGDVSLTGANSTATINPGVYCSISVNAQNGTLTLTAGTYYIDRGNIDMQAGTIDATAGVTIVFGDSTGSDACGGVNKIAGNSALNVTAPVTADTQPFTGLALYRSSDCDASEDMEFTGNTASNIEGAIYNPSGEIKVSGTGSLTGTSFKFNAEKVELAGEGTVGSDFHHV